MIRLKIVILLFTILTACDDKRVFEKNVDLQDKIWLSDSTLTFEFNVPEIRERYNIYLNLRNTLSYPYENIYINYQLSDTLNNLLGKELVNYNLFDPKSGKPYGDGLGDVFDHQLTLLTDFKFERPGPYQLRLQQYMRMDSLPEIISAGVRIERITIEK